jgi:hypothetical protein
MTLWVGGGERYLLSVVKSLQRMGYWVDVITTDINTCRSKDELIAVAKMLRVDVSANRLSYIVLKKPVLNRLASQYKVFWALGNEKVGWAWRVACPPPDLPVSPCPGPGPEGIDAAFSRPKGAR